MKRFIGIYERKGKFLFQTCSMMPNGGWGGVGDCIVLTEGSPPEQVGEAARAQLAISGTLVPKPQGDSEPLLRVAGVSSWTTFVRGCKHVFVLEEGGQLKVTPTDNTGRSFRHVNSDAILIPAASDPTLLGESVLKALANST